MTINLPSFLKHRISGGKFIVIGRAGMDLYPSPIGSSTSKAKSFESDLGGSAANIAVSLSKLGCNSSLISSFSDDGVGDFIKAKLNLYNVNTKYCNSISGVYKNSLAIAETKPENPKVVIYRNNASDLQIKNDLIENIDFSLFSGLIITGTALSSEPSRSSTHLSIQSAQKNKCPIILDLDYRQDAWEDINKASLEIGKVAKHSDICIGNDEEFNVLGLHNKYPGQEFASNLSKNGKLVVYKKGSSGCELIYLSSHFSVSAYKVNLLKPFGAGDAFMGGFISGLKDGKDLKASMVYGSACAAIVVSKIGCASAMPSNIEVNQYLKKNTLINGRS